MASPPVHLHLPLSQHMGRDPAVCYPADKFGPKAIADYRLSRHMPPTTYILVVQQVFAFQLSFERAFQCDQHPPQSISKATASRSIDCLDRGHDGTAGVDKVEYGVLRVRQHDANGGTAAEVLDIEAATVNASGAIGALFEG